MFNFKFSDGEVLSITNGKFQTFGPMGGGGMQQDFGLTVVYRVHNTDIVIISRNGQLLDTAQITSTGVDLLHKDIIIVKSNHHFRACLSPISTSIITVDGGGLGSAILSHGTYNNVRRPIWPLDSDYFK